MTQCSIRIVGVAVLLLCGIAAAIGTTASSSSCRLVKLLSDSLVNDNLLF